MTAQHHDDPFDGGSNGTLWAGMPLWARIAFVLSPSTVAAGYPVYLLSTTVSAQLINIHDDLAVNTQQQQTMADHLSEFMAAQRAGQDTVISILRADCVNNAKGNVAAVDRCMGAGK